ncbi:MAG: hypothetical protein HC879_20385 [Leptolyngbyaceae cyanobacterium SL_5_9]|nr:hypothetical protein [Leptolyngbyaceae cyanobacterium SL_5_9]NJO75962.1 hypothetical protein [Leptolyngbyaceae cyanobacterium RM1_406_9]
MLKFLSLTGVLTVISGVAIASVAQVAVSDTPVPVTSPELGESNSDDTFFCYMRTTNGTVMDLTRICATATDNRNSPQNQESSDATASSNSQDVISLENGLGVDGCYVFDTNGRPCSPGT